MQKKVRHKGRTRLPKYKIYYVTLGADVNPANGSASVAPSKKFAGSCSCAVNVKV